MYTYQKFKLFNLFFFYLAFNAISMGQVPLNCLENNFTPCIPFNVYDTLTCYPSGYPNCDGVGCPIVDETCWGFKDIKPYLARTVDMRAFWKDIYPNNWNNEEGLDPEEYTVTPTYNVDTYCQEIQMLVDLKAMFITRVGAYWGSEVMWFQYQNIWNLFEQVVKDINIAYDCAGIMRPIIQAGIWETMNTSVMGVEIPQCVIDEFSSEFTVAESNFYQPGVHFDAFRIVFDSDITGTSSPDITKIEARMWFYFLARNFIDRGYKALWLGQHPVWGRNDKNELHGNGDLFYTTQMVESIRGYAAERNTFVILNAEHGDVFRHGSDSEQLFDLGTSAIRPREIFLDPQGNKVNVDNYKGNPDNNFNDQNDIYSISACKENGDYDEKMYEKSLDGNNPCADNDYLAFIDNCHGTYNMESSPESISPNGCTWGKTPTIFYWDNGPGCYGENLNSDYLVPGEIGEYYVLLNKDSDTYCNTPETPENCRIDPEKSVHSVWGWDDKAWWIYGLGDDNECRLDWMKINSERVRDFSSEGISFLSIMGRERVACYNDLENYPADNYRLVENPVLMNGLIDFMTPNPITIDDIIVESKCTTTNLGKCGTIDICDETFDVDSRVKEYTFTVRNPSPTSIYSWHFQKEGEIWLPMSFGNTRTLLISEETQLRVYLRQDDFGLDNPYGFIQVKEEMTLKPCCIDEVNESPLKYDIKEVYEGCLISLFIENPQPNTQYFWTFSQSINYPIPSSGAYAVLDLSLSEANIIGYCLGSYNQSTGVVTTQNGFVSTDKDCDDHPKLLIVPNPINKRTDRSISIELQDKNVINEIVNKGKKLEFYIIRSIDSRKVKQFYIDSEETQVDISDLERGSYTLFTNSFGRAYNENFIVIDDF